MIKPLKTASPSSRSTPESHAAYRNQVAAENQVRAAAAIERAARLEAASRAEHQAAIDKLAIALDTLVNVQAQKAAKPMLAADRLLAVVARLVRENNFNATQAQVAEMAKCNPRELRRGGGKDVWRSYTQAGVRQPEAKQPTVAQSRQQRLVAEKMRDERRSSGE
jgi:hypothetical protein